MSMTKAIINSIIIGAIVLICAAAIFYLLSLLFMIMWNEGPAYVFNWPVIQDWWRSFLILTCAWIIFPRVTIKKEEK